MKKATCLNVMNLDVKTFSRASVNLEIHAEIGNHGNRPVSESFYDRMRREWAERFSTVDPVQADRNSSGNGICSSEETADTLPSDLNQGWVLSQALCFNAFSSKV